MPQVYGKKKADEEEEEAGQKELTEEEKAALYSVPDKKKLQKISSEGVRFHIKTPIVLSISKDIIIATPSYIASYRWYTVGISKEALAFYLFSEHGDSFAINFEKTLILQVLLLPGHRPA